MDFSRFVALSSLTAVGVIVATDELSGLLFAAARPADYPCEAHIFVGLVKMTDDVDGGVSRW